MLQGLNDKSIKMVEGDFGIILPIVIQTTTNISEDTFKITIYSKVDTEPIITKEYNNISNNTINFQLTENDSQKLKPGMYCYDLDWYNENTFLGNLIAKKNFKVEDKAGVVSGS